jgi:hypothetical protein
MSKRIRLGEASGTTTRRYAWPGVMAAVLFLVSVSSQARDACDGIGPFPVAQEPALDHIAAVALNHPGVTVRQVFKSHGWRILLAESKDADGVFVFLAPNHTKDAAATWAGAARSDETGQIRRWTLEHAQGIPAPLADCFATYVTHRPG